MTGEHEAALKGEAPVQSPEALARAVLRRSRERPGDAVVRATVRKLLEVWERGEKPSKALYRAGMASIVAMRASCDGAGVGAVFMHGDRIVTTGVNGALAGDDECFQHGCDMVNGNCVRTSHAEVNGIAFAAAEGISLKGATTTQSHGPCWPCGKLLLTAGIRGVEYLEEYKPDPRVVDAFARRGFPLKRLEV